MPNTSAPSPKGRFRKSNSATVASVRISMFTHMGRMNSTTMVCEVLNCFWLRMYAVG